MYDGRPFGRRIYKGSPSGPTVYVYDGDNIIEELNADGSLGERYTYGPGVDEPLVGQRQPKVFYYEADGLGSITSLTDPTGAVAATYTYDSFGFLTASTGSATNWFRYTARQFDSSTALYYNRARYYDPTIGRFLSEDPIGFDGGVNKYAYARTNPTNLADPSGEAGIYISYPNYPITIPGTNIKWPLGHAAVIAVDDQTGRTTYFEYGRYDSDFGQVKRRVVPDLVMGDDGLPTQESLNNLLTYISAHYGHDTSVDATYYPDADYKQIVDFALERMRDPHRAPYSWNPLHRNTCKTFAQDAIKAGLQ
jgi:RHS repeat-associated protein